MLGYATTIFSYIKDILTTKNKDPVMSDAGFLRADDTYVRKLAPIQTYIEQNAWYLYTMTKKPLEDCVAFVQSKVKETLKDPVVEYKVRGTNGDMKTSHIRLTDYLKTIVKNKYILAPTFTTYLPTSVKSSIIKEYTQNNVKVRNKAKKEAREAKAAKQTLLYITKNLEQTLKKLYNNALSGTYASAGSVIRNPSAHSTLTTITRCVSSFGNANNEKMLGGNRHYHKPSVALNNLIATSALTNKAEVALVIDVFGLITPTPDDVVKCVLHSSDLYWRDIGYIERVIRPYAESMSGEERAMFLYSGDLYHTKLLNNEFMRTMIGRLSSKVIDNSDIAVEDMYKLDNGVLNLAHQVCFYDILDLGSDYAKMKEKGVLSSVYGTARNINKTLHFYKRFFDTFILNDITPSSTAYIRQMVRRQVVLSDTDSTCFSVDNWVQWYFGDMRFDGPAIAVAGAAAFLSTQTIRHLLSLLSANIGTATETLHTLSMKNEFFWLVHMPTNVAKHYAALTYMAEGSAFGTPELEIKGAHLKNSAVNKELIVKGNVIIQRILTDIAAGKTISYYELVEEIKNIEQTIIEGAKNGGVEYLKRSSINDSEAYKLDETLSPYQRHQMWVDVFEPKYGVIQKPPYKVSKIPTTLVNKTALAEWVASIEDRFLAERLNAWLVKYKKTSLPTIYISMDYISAYKIPLEISPIVNYTQIVLDQTLQYRIILESLGMNLVEDKLVSEIYR